MKTNELLQEVRNAVSSDLVLDAWCRSKFGKAVTVYLGRDAQEPPPAEDCPVVVIVGVDQVRGASRSELTWRVHFNVGVNNGEVVAAGNTKTYTGFLQAEELREQAEDAVYRAMHGLPDTDSESEEINFGSLFVSRTAVLVSKLKSTRRGLP